MVRINIKNGIFFDLKNIKIITLKKLMVCHFQRFLEFREKEGINNRQGDMTIFIESGLRISALRNFVDRIKGLDPNDQELAVMAALVLFSLAYHDTTTPKEDCKLIERYQVREMRTLYSF